MVKILFSFLFFLVILCIAPQFIDQQGYVRIEISSYIVEMSVVSLLIIQIFFILLLLVCFYLLLRIFGVKEKISAFCKNRNINIRNKNFEDAVTSYIEGNYIQSCKVLCRRNKIDDMNLAEKLLCYSAAYKGNDDALLSKISADFDNDRNENNVLSYTILQIKMYFNLKDFEKAYFVSKNAYLRFPKNEKIISLYVKSCILYKKICEILQDNNLVEYLSSEYINVSDITAELKNKIKLASDINDLDSIDKIINSCKNVDLSEAKVFLLLNYYKLDETKFAIDGAKRILKKYNYSKEITYHFLQWNIYDNELVKLFEQKIDKQEDNEVKYSYMSILANMYLYSDREHIIKSIQLYEKLLTNSSNFEIYKGLAIAYQKLGNYQQSSLFYSKAESSK